MNETITMVAGAFALWMIIALVVGAGLAIIAISLETKAMHDTAAKKRHEYFSNLELGFEDSRYQTPEDEPHPVLSDWMVEEQRKDEIDMAQFRALRSKG